MKKFSHYITEEISKTVYFTFGRMNPPTIGHGKLLDSLSSKAGKSDYKIYVSQTQDNKKNPLTYSDKVKHIRKMFPKHARNIIVDKDIKNALDASVKLYNANYTSIVVIVGSDRIIEFKTLLNKYNGKQSNHGFYNFKSIDVISGGDRDPDSEGVEGVSSSKQREYASNNDYGNFSQNVPSSLTDKDARKLFNDVRKGMGLKEEKSYKNHIDLGKLDNTREEYIKGNLFELGDDVIIKESEEVAKICVLGSNYLILETHDGRKIRKWLSDVEKIEEKTLTPNEKKKKEEIEKAIERDNPGINKSKKIAIATAKAKEVTEQDEVSVAREKIKKEKQQDRLKHDRVLDRARILRAKRRSKGINLK